MWKYDDLGVKTGTASNIRVSPTVYSIISLDVLFCFQEYLILDTCIIYSILYTHYYEMFYWNETFANILSKYVKYFSLKA